MSVKIASHFKPAPLETLTKEFASLTAISLVLLNDPFPNLTSKTLQYTHELMSKVNTPNYDELGKGRQRLVKSGWKQYWNQEIVDFILANKYVDRLFTLTGYDRESWK